MRRMVLLLANLLLWFTLAFAFDLPRPYWDDTIIIGPSIGLLRWGELTNPFLSQTFFPFHTYLFYPPTYSWVLAGWLALFGTSTTALSAWWATLNAVASLSLGTALIRLTSRRWTYAAAPVIVFGCTAYAGLRYETLAFATFFAGLALATRSSAGSRLAGYGLLFVTPTVAPTLLGFSAVAVLALFFDGVGRRGRVEVLLAATGFAMAVLVLLLGTQGALSDLIRTMYQYRGVRIGVGGQSLYNARLLALSLVACLAVAGARLAILRESWRSIRVQLPLLLVAGLMLTLVTHARFSLLVASNIAVAFLVSLTFADVVRDLLKTKMLHERRLWSAEAAIPATFCAVLVVLNVSHLTGWESEPLPERLAAEARTMADETPPGATLVVDVPVMIALNYRTNRRIEDVMVRNPWPDILQDPRRIPAGERWIMTRSSLAALMRVDGQFRAPTRLETWFLAFGIPQAGPVAICSLDSANSGTLAGDFNEATALICRD